jgi:site-specific recombinase XerD
MKTTQGTQNPALGKLPNARRYAEVRSREHLLAAEVEAMREVIKKNGSHHAHRDNTLILVIYRHGLRVEEAVNFKWEQVDFASGNIHVRRIKQGTPSMQSLGGDEMRALRKL